MRYDSLARRNPTIDTLRGLAMLWVIMVHTLYWGNFCSNSYFNLIKSFFLFEMPVFFFVTGAGNSFSQNTGYFSYVIKRFKRILIPYWVFALICASWTIFRIIRREGIIEAKTAGKIILSWIIPADRQMTSIQYLTWAVWFIPVYLCIVLLIPMFKRIRQSSAALAFLFVLVFLFCLTSIFELGWIQNVFFYSIWTYVGLFFSDIILLVKKQRFIYLLMIIALAGIGALIILHAMGYSVDMQYNKFPPTLIFLVFSTVAISLIILALPYFDSLSALICKVSSFKKIFDLFSIRSLTVFLYQVFAFMVSIRFVYDLLPGDTVFFGIVKSAICFIFTVPICALFAMVLGKFEDIT